MNESPQHEIPERVYVMDAHGLIFQMFHGIPQMNAPDGRPTNAVFGVVRSLMNLYDIGAEYLIAAFDLPGPTFRNEIDKDYKGHRPPVPEDIIIQEPLINQVLEAMRIPRLTCPGFEADDIMATLAAKGSERGHQVFLCTADKDCRQLLSSNVRIMNLRKNEILDEETLMKDWGVRPDQVADYQALVGDSVDNVPGVPGCGAKTAAKWLQQFGSLDNIIANAQSLGGPKLRAAFLESIANGKLDASRRLVKLRTDTPLTIDWEKWRRRDWDGQRLLELFQEFGFRGFANKVRSTLSRIGANENSAILEIIGESGITPASSPKRRPDAKPSLFDQIDEVENPFVGGPRDEWSYDGYQLVNDEVSIEAFLAKLRKQNRFCFDLVTSSHDPHSAEIIGYAFCWNPGEAYYCPVRGTESTLKPADTLAAFKPIFEDASTGKVNHNIKQNLLVLRAQGIVLAGVNGDPMIAHYLLHATERSHELSDLTRLHLNHESITIESLIGKAKKIPIVDVAVAKVKDYAAEAVDTAWRLTMRFEEQLQLAGLKTLYDDLEIPLLEPLVEMEFNGVRLDSEYLALLSREMDGQLATMETTIHTLAGKSFNIASPIQLREILFDQMKLPVKKRTGKTGEASTDQESLENLAAMGHELPKAIINHRQVAKLKGTYVDALPALVNTKTKRLHTSFNQVVAATGRLSSQDPNLQNIPMRTDQGRQIRKAFLPRDGWMLLSADYSQIELRLLAHLSGDDALRRAFIEDQDVHTLVAAEIFNVPASQVTGDQRRVAKMVNFGVIYGMSAFGLSTRLGIPRNEGARFIDAYFRRYSKVLAYQDKVLAKARKVGYVATILGRRRSFDPAALRASSNYEQRNQAEREAINMEIQGSAADLMKEALLNVLRRLRQERLEAKMLLSVHDELVFEVPPKELDRLGALVREEMIAAMTLSVPLKVDVSAGPNWLEVKDV